MGFCMEAKYLHILHILHTPLGGIVTAMLEAATAWLDRGCSVIPIRAHDKRPDAQALRWAGSLNDDGGPTWNTYKDRQATIEELRLWFAVGPQHNLGVVTGYGGLVVLDFDLMVAYESWLTLCQHIGPTALAVARDSYRVRTARGMHVYVKVAEPVESHSIGRIDVKARWGYVLTAPSVHPCGHIYAVAHDGPIMEVATLADILPLAATPAEATAATLTPQRLYDDPYDAATNAIIRAQAGSIDAIKARISTHELLNIPAGHRHMIRCPFHGDNNPSMMVWADGSWKCFGCGAWGDAIDLYARLQNLDLQEAIVNLAELLGV